MLFEVDRVEDGGRDEEDCRSELGRPAAQGEQLVPLLVIIIVLAFTTLS